MVGWQSNGNRSHIIDIRLPKELNAGQQTSQVEFVRRQQDPGR